VTHPNEHEIQEYLDGTAPCGQAGIKKHLEACSRCSALVGQYRTLYRTLADDSGFTAPPALSAKVLARLAARKEQAPVPVFQDVLLFIGAGILAVAGLLLFVDLRPFFGSFGDAHAASMWATPSLVCAAGAAIIITSLLNGFLLRRHRRA
jgi:hypothetical protein